MTTPEYNTVKTRWGHPREEDKRRREEGIRKLKEINTGHRVWIPVAFLFLFLCVLTWINEFFDLYHHIFGISHHIPVNWDEALSETIIVAGVGIITVSILIRNIHKRRAAEKELKEHHQYLEETVTRRTLTLQHMVDAMAGRVVRVSELELAARELRRQVEEAGMVPAADLPTPKANDQSVFSLREDTDDNKLRKQAKAHSRALSRQDALLYR